MLCNSPVSKSRIIIIIIIAFNVFKAFYKIGFFWVETGVRMSYSFDYSSVPYTNALAMRIYMVYLYFYYRYFSHYNFSYYCQNG